MYTGQLPSVRGYGATIFGTSTAYLCRACKTLSDERPDYISPSSYLKALLSNNNTCFNFTRYMQSIKVHQVSKYWLWLTLQKLHTLFMCQFYRFLHAKHAIHCFYTTFLVWELYVHMYFIITFKSIPVKSREGLKSTKLLHLISVIFRFRPHVFINITSDIIQGDAPGIKPLGMLDPPLAVMNCDVPAASIHGFKEGHLVMWLMVINLPPPCRK